VYLVELLLFTTFTLTLKYSAIKSSTSTSAGTIDIMADRKQITE